MMTGPRSLDGGGCMVDKNKQKILLIIIVKFVIKIKSLELRHQIWDYLTCIGDDIYGNNGDVPLTTNEDDMATMVI